MKHKDVIPDNSKRIAYWLGVIFHPYLICIPTLFAVLSDLAVDQIVLWTLIILGIFVLPNAILVLYMQRHGKYIYQRRSRTPIYVLGLITLLLCMALLLVFNGPRVLLICIVALIIWIPIQLAINSLFTKISTHMAVVSGCAMALLIMGKLNRPLLLLAIVVVIILTGWARIQTKNHTKLQVILGCLVGGGVVAMVFSTLL